MTTINKLALAPVPGSNRIGDLNAQIYALEEKLSIRHQPPIFNPVKAEARIAALLEIEADQSSEAASPEPTASRNGKWEFFNVGKANAEIKTLCGQLGIEVGRPEFRIGKANARVSELRKMVAKKAAAAPTEDAVSEILQTPVSQVAAPKPASTPLEKSVENMDAGFPHLTEGARMGLKAHIQAGRKMFSEIAPRIRAEVPAVPVAAAPRIVSGETFLNMDAATRQNFFTDGGALSKSDFDKLTPRAKTNFCVNGGKLVD